MLLQSFKGKTVRRNNEDQPTRNHHYSSRWVSQPTKSNQPTKTTQPTKTNQPTTTTQPATPTPTTTLPPPIPAPRKQLRTPAVKQSTTPAPKKPTPVQWWPSNLTDTSDEEQYPPLPTRTKLWSEMTYPQSGQFSMLMLWCGVSFRWKAATPIGIDATTIIIFKHTT